MQLDCWRLWSLESAVRWPLRSRTLYRTASREVEWWEIRIRLSVTHTSRSLRWTRESQSGSRELPCGPAPVALLPGPVTGQGRSLTSSFQNLLVTISKLPSMYRFEF